MILNATETGMNAAVRDSSYAKIIFGIYSQRPEAWATTSLFKDRHFVTFNTAFAKVYFRNTYYF